MLVPAALLLVLLLTAPGSLVLGQECSADGTCDTHERCPVWAKEGKCTEEAVYMKKHCPASCSLPKKSSTEEECVDRHPRCALYASVGECESGSESQAREFCPKSCNLCGTSAKTEVTKANKTCVDSNKNCEFWAARGECLENDMFMKQHCPKSCNTCGLNTSVGGDVTAKSPKVDALDALQQATEEFGQLQKAEGSEAAKTVEIIKKSIIYMDTKATELPFDVLEKCLNRHNLCSFWAAIGECEANQAYMVTNCAPACRTCNLIDMESRCPPLEDAKPALVPGGLNEMFEDILKTAPGNRTLSTVERRMLQDKKMPEYTVTVHSRPPMGGADVAPWIVVFDNFTTEEECQHLIDLGYQNGYERSRDVGKKKFDGSYDAQESTRRTSENAWCSFKNKCRSDEVTQRIHNRMGEVMGIDPENSEDLQLLKYEINQFYRVHHDYIPHHRDRQCGPRILTFFLYLSDVEEGGGTAFPNLGITVKPKVGRALLWPSVMNNAPLEKDGRTMHEALPVIRGTKFAANGWIHMYDYLTPNEKGCT